MAHGTTLPTPVCSGHPRPPRESLDQGDDTRGPRVEVEGQRVRGRTSRFCTQWRPDTPSNRHITGVWFRLLVDAHGNPWFTLQELAALVESENRQAASQHLEDFRQCGEDFRSIVLRQRKVEAPVVKGS